ncbi:hypothetical protein PtA15_3A901 [Puccinia triticina]|uniref:Uncharacterized protein n=1 Tax=Puccinia triticina TaxID=208348 RepID=A0ABY7CEK2_9BASI|nr:uncharacterized protein PtA15_3A901 [Puccinia triticina]WAQ83530.1 hypothetical protein PtA15_3A901 [Puccinia triticina]
MCSSNIDHHKNTNTTTTTNKQDKQQDKQQNENKTKRKQTTHQNQNKQLNKCHSDPTPQPPSSSSLAHLGTQLACSAPHPGYVLQLSSLPITLPPQIDPSTLNTTIATLTYALILHPIAAGLALLSAIFGLVSHIRELNAIANPSFSVKAELGHAVWITLEYIDQMRIDAHQAEKAREKEQASLRNQASLPAFAEYPEHIPLNRFNPNEDEQTTAPYNSSSDPSAYPHNRYIPPLPPMPNQHLPGGDIYSNLPPHVSPASNTMNPPHRTPSSLTNRRLPQSLIPAGGMAHTNASNTPPGSYSSNAIHPPNSYPSTPPSSSSTLAAKPSLPAYYPAGPQPSHQASLDSTHRPRPLPSPGPQPIHQASIDSAHRAFPHQPYQTQPLYPAQNTLSEEPDQLPDPNPQYPFGQNINLSDQYPSSQNMHLSPSGHQLDTNRSTVYSQATSVPFVPQPRDAQDPGTRFAGYPADGRSTVYSQATTAAPLGAPEQPQPYGHHPHVSASAPGQEPDEHDMYGGTEALSYRPEIGNPHSFRSPHVSPAFLSHAQSGCVVVTHAGEWTGDGKPRGRLAGSAAASSIGVGFAPRPAVCQDGPISQSH